MIKTSNTLGVLAALIAGLKLQDIKLQKSNWNAKGCECVLQFEGQFYKIRVEPMEETNGIKTAV